MCYAIQWINRKLTLIYLKYKVFLIAATKLFLSMLFKILSSIKIYQNFFYFLLKVITETCCNLIKQFQINKYLHFLYIYFWMLPILPPLLILPYLILIIKEVLRKITSKSFIRLKQILNISKSNFTLEKWKKKSNVISFLSKNDKK